MTEEKKKAKEKKPPEKGEAGEKPEVAEGTAAEGGAAAAPVEPTVDLKALEAKARERDEYLSLLQRTAAEFANYRKRVERERAEWTDRAFGDFVLKLLPALDDFDRALSRAAEKGSVDAVVAGVRLIEKKFHEILKLNGVETFEAKQGPFNPEEHEAAGVELTDQVPDGNVAETLVKGYRLRGRVLRPAKVKVAKKPEAEEEPQGTEGPKV
jgi:molecular chaperone GrpE